LKIQTCLASSVRRQQLKKYINWKTFKHS